MKYLKTEFIFDFLSIMSIFFGYFNVYFLIFLVLKIKCLNKYLYLIDDYYQLTERYHTIWILFKLFIFVITVAHYFACIFHYAAFINREQINWMNNFSIDEADYYTQYNCSLYFSLITVISIGYGDITPANNSERNVVIVMSIISSGCFAYIVNTIGTIF